MATIGTILGNIGGDARVVTLGQTQALEFSVASKRTRKNQNGEKVTDWVDVLYFKTGLQPYLTKGRSVLVTGEMEFNAYQSRNGELKCGIKIVADRIELASGPTQDMEQPTHDAQPQQAPPPPPQAAQPQQFSSNDGQLPF